MTDAFLQQAKETYRTGLLESVVPFWLRHGLDAEHGGVMTSLDRDGSPLDTDKAIWPQGRFAWLMSTLHATVEPRAEWLDAARSALDFLRRHAFDADGRMFFLVTRDGQPLRKRRYAYSEAFAAMAFAAYARAAGDGEAAETARDLFWRFVRLTTTPGLLEPKTNPQTRPAKGLGVPMITMGVAQTLRDTLDVPEATSVIDRCIEEIRRDFVKPDLEAVMETVGPQGEVLDHFGGRQLNPGHAIEAAWFILHEARHRGGDADLTALGTTMLDWMWRRGWDDEHGGLFYFRDLHGRPVQEYWHDMKFWWPHCEAIIATLLAYALTGEQRYADWHRQVHDWTHARFPDPDYGEWYGYLHRDGRLSVPLKGNYWKGPFHIPRMQWYSWQLLDSLDLASTTHGSTPAP